MIVLSVLGLEKLDVGDGKPKKAQKINLMESVLALVVVFIACKPLPQAQNWRAFEIIHSPIKKPQQPHPTGQEKHR